MKLSDKILSLRKQAGFSQEELAEQLNVSRQAVSRWEVGSAIPDALNVLQLSKLFGVTADYLLNDDYESDRDVPAIKATETAGKEMFRKMIALSVSACGLACNFLIYVISRFVKVMIPYVYHDENGKEWYRWTADYTGYSYRYFIEDHNLKWLTILFWALFAAGLVYLLIHSRFFQNTKKKLTLKLKERKQKGK